MAPASNSSSASKRFFCAAALVLLAAAGAILLDLPLSRSINLNAVPGDLRRVLGLSEFFAHGFGVAVVLITIATLAPHLRRSIPRLATCAILPGLIVNLIKFSVGRYRPGAAPRGLQEIGETWVAWFPTLNPGRAVELGYAIESFPSGHTATAFGLAVGLGWLLPGGRVLFFTLACLAAAQRIVFEAHWLSDVLVGCAIGVLVAHWVTLDQQIPGRWFARLECSGTASAAMKTGAHRPAA